LGPPRVRQTARHDRRETLCADIGAHLNDHHERLAIAESLTGGGLSQSFAAAPGSSGWFLGGVVAYQKPVKFAVLGVPEGPVVSEAAAVAMAEGVRALLGADVAAAVTGAGGPDGQDGQPPGTVWVAVSAHGAHERPGAPLRR
jgi:nicotinamide-nucleotide amidase